MKHISSILLLFIFSFSAHADFNGYDYVEKPFSIGIGTYASKIIAEDDSVVDAEFGGVALTITYVFSDHFSLRGNYFSLEEDTFSNLESKGFDLLAYLGTGMANQGFKAYIGGGVFKDKWTGSANSKSFNGLQLSGGFGYNWESVSLDFLINLRDASDYDDYFNEGVTNKSDVGAASGALLLSYRF